MTNESLITEVREFLTAPNLGKPLMRELDKAMIHIRRLADALETFEARVKELESQVKDLKCEQVFRISEMQELVEAQQRISELESKLAAVPDAATWELERAYDLIDLREFEIDDLHEIIIELRAERDAALAAVERVRVAKHEVDSVHQIHGTECLCGFSSARSRSRTEHITEAMLAALDGAPEPEVLELPETGLEVRDSDGDLISTGEHRRVLHQGGYVCDTCVNILGINVRWDRADRVEGHPLPVEGESDGV